MFPNTYIYIYISTTNDYYNDEFQFRILFFLPTNRGVAVAELCDIIRLRLLTRLIIIVRLFIIVRLSCFSP